MSPIRITGMSSGLDTDAIIKDLMKIEQLKVDRQFRQKTTLEWKKAAYTDVNTQLRSFREKYFSVLNGSSNLLSTNTYNANKVSLSDSSALSITASSSAFAKSLSIQSVSLATGATIRSDSKGQSHRAMLTAGGHVLHARTTGASTPIGADDLTKTLNDAEFVDAQGKNIFGFSESVSTVSFTVNGKTVSLTADMTVQAAMDAVNGAGAGVAMAFDSGKFTLTSTTGGSSAGISLANGTGTALGSNTGFGISAGSVSPNTALITGASTLEQLAQARGLALPAGDTYSFAINGQTFIFGKNDTIDVVMSAVNANAGAKAELGFDKVSGTFALRSDVTGSATGISAANVSGNFFGADGLTQIAEGSSTAYATVKKTDTLATAAFKLGNTLELNGDGKFAVTVAGKEFTFAQTATVNEMLNEVNNAGLGVKMNYSEISDEFSFENAAISSSSTLAIDGFDSLGITAKNAAGTDAKITFTNGDTIVQSSNTFTLDGLTFGIKANYSGAAPITATVSKDVSGVVEKIKNFITDYNALIDSLSGKLVEKKDYDFRPLTDAEKDDMSEEEIKKWEDKAKEGLLASDPTLSGLLFDLRKSLYTAVEGTGLKPSDLGLNTSTWSSTGAVQKGQLTFDAAAQEKLTAAFEKDPEKIIKTLANRSSSTDSATAYSQSGFFTRLSNKMNDYISTTTSGVIKSTTGLLTDATSKLTELTDALTGKEDAYYLKFAKLESAMTKMNSQSSWFSSQMSAMG